MTAKHVSKRMLQAWQKTLIELSRLTKKDKEDPDLSGMVRKLARGEKSQILKLREVFTTDREGLSYSLLSNKENILAYMLGFHMPNLYRLMKTFERVQEKWKWSLEHSGASSLTVWDLGCGSGVLSQFFIEEYSQHFSMSRAYLYDTNSLLLQASKNVFEHLNLDNVKTFPRKVGLQDLNTQPKVFPEELVVIGLGYVWNELQRNKNAQKKIHALIKHYLDHNAKVLISLMEPGQDFASRAAMALRDDLVTKGFTPLYPCPHLGQCPMLKREKDWCYSEFSAEEFPKDSIYIDGLLDIERNLVASSAFVFASPALFATIKNRPAEQPVVVGRPKEKDGEGFGYLLCTPKADLSKIEGITAARKAFLRGERYPTGVFNPIK